MADQYLNKFLNAVESGQKAANRMNFGFINDIKSSDFISSDTHRSSSSLNMRQDAFVFGYHLWGSDDHKVI